MAVASALPFLSAFLNRFCNSDEPEEVVTEQEDKLPPAAIQQQELEYLCSELFKKRSLVTSGKLQLIGLEKVKRSLGAKWPAMQALVYQTTEAVIARHLTKGDIHLRHKEDSYLILFATASREEGDRAAERISKEITDRLFSSADADLRKISIKKHIVQTKTSLLAGKSLCEVLEKIGCNQDIAPIAPVKKTCAPAPVFSFIPLWEVKMNAITTYMCQVGGIGAGPQADLLVLSRAMAELHRLQEEHRPALIMCPVSYSTLSLPGNFQKYELLCKSIPEEQRPFLIFKMNNLPESAMKAGGAHFSIALKKYCRAVYVQAPAVDTIELSGLHNAGFDGAGISADMRESAESAVLQRLRMFSMRAEAAKPVKKFLLDVSSVSLAASAVCMSFDYISGPVILAPVAKPEGILRYRHSDLAAQVKKT